MSTPEWTEFEAAEAMDAFLTPAAEAVTASIITLGEMLAEMELIDTENVGVPRWHVDLGTGELVDGIEVAEPEPRLYALQGTDAVVATRQRSDGRYEHAVLDEDGMPGEWRTVHPSRMRPDRN